MVTRVGNIDTTPEKAYERRMRKRVAWAELAVAKTKYMVESFDDTRHTKVVKLGSPSLSQSRCGIVEQPFAEFRLNTVLKTDQLKWIQFYSFILNGYKIKSPRISRKRSAEAVGVSHKSLQRARVQIERAEALANTTSSTSSSATAKRLRPIPASHAGERTNRRKEGTGEVYSPFVSYNHPDRNQSELAFAKSEILAH